MLTVRPIETAFKYNDRQSAICFPEPVGLYARPYFPVILHSYIHTYIYRGVLQMLGKSSSFYLWLLYCQGGTHLSMMFPEDALEVADPVGNVSVCLFDAIDGGVDAFGTLLPH